MRKSKVWKRLIPAMIVGVSLPVASPAQGLRDYFDKVDLNDYALSLNFYHSTSSYSGIEDFNIVYPTPTSFEHATTTEEAFFIRDANIGLRNFTDNGWSYGGFLTLQTLTYGSDTSPALEGMRRRAWSIQAGGKLGKRIGNLNLDVFASADILGEYDGQEYVFKIAYPFSWPNVRFVPQLEAKYQTDNTVNHYYGVRESEATPARPAYAPGAATTWSASADLSWRFHPKWYVTGGISVDFLPDKIRNSPLVDVDSTWRINLGIAYDARAFMRLEKGAGRDYGNEFDLGVEVFFLTAESNINLENAGIVAANDLEREQNLDKREVVVPVEFIWRFGRFHRLDLRYFTLLRTGSIDLAVPLNVSDAQFAAGETIDTEFETRVLRLGYGFSFLRDEQKDLSLFGGMHVTDIDYRVSGNTESVAASATPILPMLGLRFRANVTERLSAAANLELFVLDFDRFSGDLIDFSASGMYRLGNSFFVGAGYRFYRQDIDSGNDKLQGDLRIQYKGPYIALRARF